jgi:hypothetical protein
MYKNKVNVTLPSYEITGLGNSKIPYLNYIITLQKISTVVNVSLRNSTGPQERSIQRSDALLWPPLNELIKTS